VNSYLYRVTLGGLTFGVDVDDGVITGVAPVAQVDAGEDDRLGGGLLA
jgi:hypothetical protein